MTAYPPSETARADQHYAGIRNQLDQLIDVYRRRRQDEEQAECLDLTVSRLSCPHKGDGTVLPPEVHAGTLANLLGVAIDRLATDSTDRTIA